MGPLQTLLYLLVTCSTVVSAAGTATSSPNNPSLARTSTMTTSSSQVSFSLLSQTAADSSFTVPLLLTSTPTPSSTTSSAPTTFTVQVGNGGFQFKPDVIQAAVGDVSHGLEKQLSLL